LAGSGGVNNEATPTLSCGARDTDTEISRLVRRVVVMVTLKESGSGIVLISFKDYIVMLKRSAVPCQGIG
jgi:hypothetical protein